MLLRNQYYDRILREYDQMRLYNKHILDDRYEEVYHNVPEIKRIDDQIVTSSIKQARQALLNETHSLPSLKEEIQNLSKAKTDLLLKHGYEEGYLDPIYTCSDCQDTGYVDNKPCHCLKQSIIYALYEQSNIQNLLKINNFSNFQYDYYSDDDKDSFTELTPRENIRKVVGICQDFIQNFEKRPRNLFIYGNTGVGKTFLTHCIAKELLDRYHTVLYLTSFQFFEILEKTKFRNNFEVTDYDEYLPYLLDCELLILDDLGTELVNSFTASQLFHYINERHMQNKSTIISTNLTLDELNVQYSERVFSRITRDYSLLKIIGDDIRLKQAIK